MTARVSIGPKYDLKRVAEAAGQPDEDKRLYRNGELIVDGVTQTALEAAAAEAVIAQPPVVYAPFDFVKRFTEAERADIRELVQADPRGPIADFMSLIQMASEIPAEHPDTIAGMDALVAAGAITEARKQEILGT